MFNPGRFGDGRRLRVGLLGGSFNPAHRGHRHIATVALRRLRLDQVWLLVSPGNPLKHAHGMAPLAERLASAAALVADQPRIVATAIERQIGTRYTVDTLERLRRLFPHVRFVWLMGADNLRQLPAWRGWLRIVADTPFAVLPRPGYTAGALVGAAASRWRRARRPAAQAGLLAGSRAPAWLLLPARQDASSATALRSAAAGSTSPKRPELTPTRG